MNDTDEESSFLDYHSDSDKRQAHQTSPSCMSPTQSFSEADDSSLMKTTDLFSNIELTGYPHVPRNEFELVSGTAPVSEQVQGSQELFSAGNRHRNYVYPTENDFFLPDPTMYNQDRFLASLPATSQGGILAGSNIQQYMTANQQASTNHEQSAVVAGQSTLVLGNLHPETVTLVLNTLLSTNSEFTVNLYTEGPNTGESVT
jgi:hypothetical protein